MAGGFDQSINRFRARRGKILQGQIIETSLRLGRNINILDIGGRANYWANVGFVGINRIVLLNVSEKEFSTGDSNHTLPERIFERRVGDGCDLQDYPDLSMDMVHSNSVIEHVGGWSNMVSMSREARRVGRSGWIQTPALEFPIEPHFHLPIVHWLGKPIQASALRISPLAVYRACDGEDRKRLVDGIRLLSKREVTDLFPGCDIYTETLVFPKSYVARWQASVEGSRPAAALAN